jgi:hypothetical protein
MLDFKFEPMGVDRAALARDALRSMQALPVLGKLLIEIHPLDSKLKGIGFRGVGIHRLATNILDRQLTAYSSTERRLGGNEAIPFRFMDLPTEIQFGILEYTGVVAPGPVIASNSKGYALDNYQERCQRGYLEKAEYDSSKGCCWSLPADLFLVSRHISAMSSEIFFSRNELVVDVVDVGFFGFLGPPLDARPAPVIWTRTDSGHCRHELGVWYPDNSKFLTSVPPAYIGILKSLTWRVAVHNGTLSKALAADWTRTIDFIAENVKPLSKLTITLKMTGSQLCDTAMEPLKKLQDLGLRGLSVHLSGNRDQGIGASP